MLSLVFPGQGSQFVGMGHALREAYPEARHVFEEVDDTLNQKLSKLMWEGSEAELSATENAQPALLAVSIAAFSVLKKEFGKAFLEKKIRFFAGHSLGEISALQAAGCLPLVTAVRLLRLRGIAMRDACPNKIGGMVALLGADLPLAQKIARESAQATDKVCEVANDNAPGQIVLSGSMEAISYAAAHAPSLGVKKSIILNVSGPFHSSLMGSAQEKLSLALQDISFQDPSAPIVQNTTAQPTTNLEKLKQGLPEQITHCVRWRESVIEILQQGTEFFIECGAGSVLTSLIKRTAKNFRQDKAMPQGQDIMVFSFGGPHDISALSSYIEHMHKQ